MMERTLNQFQGMGDADMQRMMKRMEQGGGDMGDLEEMGNMGGGGGPFG
jgi:signal recognition particle subunit SRP54